MSTATEIIEHPILFKGEMVRAILADQKTQTRRVMKDPSVLFDHVKLKEGRTWEVGYIGYCPASRDSRWVPSHTIKCPYKLGDHLWVRETWKPTGMFAGYRPRDTRACARFAYAADSSQLDRDKLIRWRPSIHMPRWASRITLEITEIRAQRVQDITEEDAKAEGVTPELIEQLLEPLARRADVRPYHWVQGGNEAIGYCDKCIDKAVRATRKRYPKDNDIDIGGGYSTQDEEGMACCASCAKLLDYTLTEWGVKEELGHFESVPLGKIGPCQAYQLCRIFEEVSKDPETLARIRRLGMRILWDSINARPKAVKKNPAGEKEECFVSYPWENINETREHRGKKWYVIGNPWVWAYTFKRIEGEK